MRIRLYFNDSPRRWGCSVIKTQYMRGRVVRLYWLGPLFVLVITGRRYAH